MSLELMTAWDWATLAAALAAGLYVLAVRHVRLHRHGALSVALHVGSALVCAAAAADAMQGRSGVWLLAVAGVVVWLADTRTCWTYDRPRRVRHPGPTKLRTERARERTLD